MPQTVDIEGVGLVDFPDDFTDERISSTIEREFKPYIARQKFAAEQQQKIARGREAAAQPEISPVWEGFKGAGRAIESAGGNVARGLTGAVVSPLKMAGTVADYIRTKTGDVGSFDTGPDKRSDLTQLAEGIEKKVVEYGPRVREEDRDQFLAGDVASGLGQVAGMMLGGGVTGAVAKAAGKAVLPAALAATTTLGFTAEFGDAFERAKARGDDPDTSLAKALGYASVAALIENKLGAGRLLKKWMPDPKQAVVALTKAGVAKEILKDLVVGYGEEALQRSAQDLIVDGKLDPEGINREGLAGGFIQALVGAPAAGRRYQPSTAPTSPAPTSPAAPSPAPTALRPAGPVPVPALPQLTPQTLATPIQSWQPAPNQPHTLAQSPASFGVGNTVVKLSQAGGGFGKTGVVTEVTGPLVDGNPNPTVTVRFDDGTTQVSGFKEFGFKDHWDEANNLIIQTPPVPRFTPEEMPPAENRQRTAPLDESEQLQARINVARKAGDAALARKLGVDLDALGMRPPVAQPQPAPPTARTVTPTPDSLGMSVGDVVETPQGLGAITGLDGDKITIRLDSGGTVVKSAATATPIPVAPAPATGTATQVTNIEELVQQGGGRVRINDGGKEVIFDKFAISIEGDEATVGYVELKDKTAAGKGIGKKAYIALGLALARRGITLKSSGALLGPGQKLWLSMVRDGYAVREGSGYSFKLPSTALTPAVLDAVRTPTRTPNAPAPVQKKTAVIDADAIAENGLDQRGLYEQETPELKQSIFNLFLKKAASIGKTDIRSLSRNYASNGLSGDNGGVSLSFYLASADGTGRTFGDNPAKGVAWEFRFGREVVPVTWGDLAESGIAIKNPDGTIRGSGFVASSKSETSKKTTNAPAPIPQPSRLPVQPQGTPSVGQVPAETKPVGKPIAVARPFSPDDILIAHSTFTDDDFEVSYRGPLGDDKSVVWTGRTQMTVPNSWLRRKGEPLKSIAPGKIARFPQAPEPSQFNSTAELLTFRKQRLAEEVAIYQQEIGLTLAEATRLQELMAREMDTANFEKKIGPAKASKLSAFFDGPFNQKASPLSFQFWEFDKRLDPEQIALETDKGELVISIVSAVDRGIEASVSNDRFLSAAIAAMRLKERGGTLTDVAKQLDQHTTKNSSSQGDKVEYFKSLGAKVNAFLASQGIQLPQGEFAKPPAKVSSRKPQNRLRGEVKAQSEKPTTSLSSPTISPTPSAKTGAKMTRTEMEDALAVLLMAPSRAGGKPRVSFKTQIEQTWFRRGFEAANENPGQPPPKQQPGVPAKEQKLHDAFAQGWSQAQIKLRTLPTPASTKATKAGLAQKLDAAIESAKIKPGSLYSLPDLGLTVTLWNGTLNAVQLSIRAGQKLAQAIQAGIDWLRAQGQQFDEAKVRAALDQSILQSPSVRVKSQTVAGRAVGTSQPTTKVRTGEGTDPSHNVELSRLREVNPIAYRKNAMLLTRYPVVARDQPRIADLVRKIDAPILSANRALDRARDELETLNKEAIAVVASTRQWKKIEVKKKHIAGFLARNRRSALAGNFKVLRKKIRLLTKLAEVESDKSKAAMVELLNNRDLITLENADAIYESYINAVESNLETLAKLFPSRLRDLATLWYDGANLIGQRFGSKYRTTLEQASAVLAVFSPQKDWFMNVSLAERMMSIWKNEQDAVWSPEMTKQFIKRSGEPQPKMEKTEGGTQVKTDKEGNILYQGGAVPVEQDDGTIVWTNWDNKQALENIAEARQLLPLLEGKRLRDLTNPRFQARFVRMFSEVNHPIGYQKVAPNGEFVGNMTNDEGVEMKIAWGGYGTIEKAISILQADRASEHNVISEALGAQHKVRSFYNNIVDPQNQSGHVTMDTHAVAALLWLPLSGASVEVTQNFGGAGVQNSGAAGIKGTYAANAEAYRRAAKALKLLPRELQSITWEAVRMLFPAKWKSSRANVANVRAVWQRYLNNELTIEQARAEIFRIATTGKEHPQGRDIDRAIEDGTGVGEPSWAAAMGDGASDLGDLQEADDAGVLSSGGRDGRLGLGQRAGDAGGISGRRGSAAVVRPVTEGSDAGRLESGPADPSLPPPDAMLLLGGPAKPVLPSTNPKEFGRGYIHINVRGGDLDLSKSVTGWVLPAELEDYPNTMSTRYGAPGKTAIFVPKEWVVESKTRPAKIKDGYKPLPEHIAVIPKEAMRPSGTVDWSKVFTSTGGPAQQDSSDQAYLAAVERGDMAEAQRMVDAAAEAAGFYTEVYHGGSVLDVFDTMRGLKSKKHATSGLGSFFSEKKAVAEQYGQARRYFISIANPMVLSFREAAEIESPETAKYYREQAEKLGHDGFLLDAGSNDDPSRGMLIDREWVALSPSQIKSADPITRDAQGNVIPLSQRFQSESPDIRYSLGQATVGENRDYTSIPNDKTVTDSLSSDKKPFVGAARNLPVGTPVGLRIDIPAFERTGNYVVTVHEKASGGKVGKRIGYDGIATVDNPVFYSNVAGAARVKDGAPKFPLATVEGAWSSSRAIPDDIDSWTPVGYNPKDHSYFYDKRTGNPVLSGSRAISVGNTVFVRDPVFGRKEDYPFSLGSPATTTSQRSLSVKEVKEALNVFGFGGVPKGVEVTHRLDIIRNGREVRGWYNPATKSIWLNAAYIRTPEEARAVFIEEAFHAVQNDPKVKAVMARLLASLTPEQLATAQATYGNVEDGVLRYESVADLLEQESFTGEQRGMWQQLWTALKDAMTKLFGLVNPNWIPVATDARTMISHALRMAGRSEQTNVGDDRSMFSLGNLSEAATQVAATKIAAMGQNRMDDFQAAADKLEQLADEKVVTKQARASLRTLAGHAEARLLNSPNPSIARAPRPDDGVAVVTVRDAAGNVTGERIEVDETFTDGLSALGIANNPATVKAQQAEIFFERESSRLVSLRRELAHREELVRFYEAKPDPAPFAAEIDRQRQIILRSRSTIADLGAVQHEALTVGQRADQIEAAQNGEIENRSLAAARNIPQVVETFGEPGAEREGLLASIASILADPTNITEEVMTLRALLGTASPATQFMTLPENQKQVAIAALAKLFQQFDLNRQSLQATRDTTFKVLGKKFAVMKAELDEATLGQVEQEKILNDILLAARGNPITSIGLQTQAEVDALLNSLSATISFVKAIGADPSLNQPLYDWLTTGMKGPHPTIVGTVGASSQVLQTILDISQKSPLFGNAVVALVRNAQKQVSSLPGVQLAAIAAAVKAGDTQQVAALVDQMNQDARAAVTAAKAMQANAAHNMAGITVTLRSLENALGLFNTVMDSPDFKALRAHVESDSGAYVVRFKLDNKDRMTLKAFGVPGIPQSDEVSLLPVGDSDYPQMHDAWRNKAMKWFKTAEEYVANYESLKRAHLASPTTFPTPESLGYEAPVARGLQQAIFSDMPALMSFDNFNPLNKLQSSWVLRLMQGNHPIGKVFRNPQRVVDMIGGIFGAKARQDLADLSNGKVIANRINHQYKNLDTLRGEAMRSHDKDGIGRVVEVYGQKVWQEMAHENRQFGSPVKAGYRLPTSGLVVTPEDMAYLKLNVEFSNTARRELEEFRTDRGVVVNVGGKEFVRKGASPGDNPLPRILSGDSKSLVDSLVSTTEGDAKSRAFDTTTDLSGTSTNPVVKFWNRSMDAVVRHVLDSGRNDRSMKLDPRMAIAEQKLAADIRAGLTAPTSLAETAQLLAARLPSISGVMAYDFAVRQLGIELEQYRREAAEIAATDRAQAKNSGIEVILSSQNEYTKPAALLRLPSNWYSYGSLTDGQKLFALERGTHERAVAFVTSMDQAVRDMDAALDHWNSLKSSDRTDAKEAEVFKQFGGLLQAQQTKRIVEATLQDAVNQYRLAVQASESGGAKILKGGFRLTLSMLLAGMTVGINNTISSTFSVYLAHNTASRLIAVGGLIAASKHLVRIATQAGLMATHWLAKTIEFGVDRDVQKWLSSKAGTGFLSGAIKGMAERYLGLNPWQDVETVQRLGFSQTDQYFERLQRIWDELSEFDDSVQMDSAKKNRLRDKAFRIVRVLGKAESQFYVKTGIELQDLVINAASLASVKSMENDLKLGAINYGKAREKLGLTTFDFSDPRWQANASEFFLDPRATVREKQLAMTKEKFQQFGGSTGAQLEKLSWDYYQAQKTNPDAPFFTDSQWDNFARQTLSDLNASTKANRPSYAQANPDAAILTMFWGYGTWMANTLVSSLRVTRGTKTGAALASQLPAVLGIVAMATLVGLLALTGKEEYNRRFRGKTSRNPVLTDPEFWGSPRAAATAAAIGAASMIPVLGTVGMAIQDFQSGGKGYDPAGAIVPLSLASSVLTAVRGVVALPVQDWGLPLEDLLSKIAPRYQEAMALVGRNRAGKNASNIYDGALRTAGFDLEKKGSSSGGAAYGPTTGMKRSMEEAVYDMGIARAKGDSDAYSEALTRATAERNRLVGYYRDDKGMTQEKAEAAAWRDYQDLNPLRKAYQGKVMTEEEYRRVDAALGNTERASQARAALADFSAGGQALFGVVPANTKREAGGSSKVDDGSSSPSVRASGGGSSGGRSFGVAKSGTTSYGGGNRIRSASVRIPSNRIRGPKRIAIKQPAASRVRYVRGRPGRSRNRLRA